MTLVRRSPHDRVRHCGGGLHHAQRLGWPDQPTGDLIFDPRSVDGRHELEADDHGRSVAQQDDRREARDRNKRGGNWFHQLHHSLGLQRWRHKKSHGAPPVAQQAPVPNVDNDTLGPRVQGHKQNLSDASGFLIASGASVPLPVDNPRRDCGERVLFPSDSISFRRLPDGGRGRTDAPSLLWTSGRTLSACRCRALLGAAPDHLAAPCRGQARRRTNFPTAECLASSLFTAQRQLAASCPDTRYAAPGGSPSFHRRSGE